MALTNKKDISMIQGECSCCRQYILENCMEDMASLCCKSPNEHALFIDLLENDHECFEQVLISPQLSQGILESRNTNLLDPHLCAYAGIRRFLLRERVNSPCVADYLSIMFMGFLFKVDWKQSIINSPQKYTKNIIATIHNEIWEGDEQAVGALHVHLAEYCLFLITIMRQVFSDVELSIKNDTYYKMLAINHYFAAADTCDKHKNVFKYIAKNFEKVSSALKAFSKSPYV